jgi:hypothetical protein
LTIKIDFRFNNLFYPFSQSLLTSLKEEKRELKEENGEMNTKNKSIYVFLIFKEKFNKFLAHMLVARFYPNRAIFSPNPVIVAAAIGGAYEDFKIAAFKRAVTSKNKPVAEMLMIRSDINDYFLLANGFEIENYNKKYVKKTALCVKNFDVLMKVCKNYMSFRKFGKKEMKTAARAKFINWDKLLNIRWVYNVNFIKTALKVKPLPADKDLLYKSARVANYLLKVNKYDLDEEDKKKFIEHPNMIYLIFKHKLFNYLELMADYLFSFDIDVLPYLGDIVFSRETSINILSRCIECRSPIKEVLVRKGCIALTASEIFREFYGATEFIWNLREFINIKAELKKNSYIEHQYVQFYEEKLKEEEKEKPSAGWIGGNYFYDHIEMQKHWSRCI